MIIGSIKEHDKQETRTSLTPQIVKELTIKGHTILLEKSIGKKSFFSNQEYINAGAKFSSPENIYNKSELILQIQPPSTKLLSQLKKTQIIASDFSNFTLSTTETKATILQLEKVPRTSIAQSIDILSSQHTARGYASALYALSHSPIIAPQLFTASSSIKQANALIIGASITGLQASTIFKKNGCKVTILDINKDYQELAQSVGANLIIAKTDNQLQDILSSSNFVLSCAQNINSAPKIISHNMLKFLPKGTIVTDTTPTNIDISNNIEKTSSYYFYRNLYFERLTPITSSTLWADNMLNLITTITSNNTLDLEIDYIKPMIFTQNTKEKQ